MTEQEHRYPGNCANQLGSIIEPNGMSMKQKVLIKTKKIISEFQDAHKPTYSSKKTGFSRRKK